MNAAEKKILYIAMAFLVVGIAVRVFPWTPPSIETVEISERSRPEELAAPYSKVEYAPEPPAGIPAIADKVTKSEAPGEPRKPRAKKPTVHLPLKINTATEEELCALKGVGPKLAERIVAFREAHGPFKTPASLEKVPGIGKKKLEGILQGVIFD
jgi:competence protein ComEA